MRASAIQGEQGHRSRSAFLDRATKLLDGIVFSCLLGLIVLSVIPYGTVDAWWEAVFECAVFALTAIWIFEVLVRGSWQIKGLFILLPLALITLYAFFQTVGWPVAWLASGTGRIPQQTLSIDRYQTFLTAQKTLALTLFLGLLLLHTSTPKRFHWLVRVIIGLGVASALFGILRQFLQSPDSQTGFVLPFLFAGVGYGQFISPNVFAYLMEMSLALTAGLILGGAVPPDRLPFYLSIILLLWTALVLSNSRGGILALVCQSIFLLFVSLAWYSTRRLSRKEVSQIRLLTYISTSWLVKVVIIVLMVGTLIAGVLWMGGETLGLKLVARQSSSQVGSDGTGRKEIWRWSWELIKHHPVTGVGFGCYFLAVPEYQAGPGLLRLEQAHNDYLDLLANGGIVAAGLAGWFIVTIIWRVRSRFTSPDPYRRAACLGAVAGLLSVAVHSFVDFGLQVTGIAVVFGALVVIAIADSRVESLSDMKKRRRKTSSPEAVLASGNGR